MKRVIKDLEKTDFYYGSYWSYSERVLFLVLRSWSDYVNTLYINQIPLDKVSKIKDEFFTKNKGLFNLSNIGSPRKIEFKKLNLDNYFITNNLLKIPTTKKLKFLFLRLSLSYYI